MCCTANLWAGSLTGSLSIGIDSIGTGLDTYVINTSDAGHSVLPSRGWVNRLYQVGRIRNEVELSVVTRMYIGNFVEHCRCQVVEFH